MRFDNVLKRSLQDVLKTSSKRLEDVLKIFWRRLEDVLKRLQEVWARRLYWSWSRYLEDVLNTSSEDVWVKQIYSSWSRRLEHVCWRRRPKKSSRCLHQDDCLLGCYTHNHTIQDSTYNHLYKNSNHLVLYTYTNIDHDVIFILLYMHFHSNYIYTHTINDELKILFHLPRH